jgi:hypothetical protein
MKVINVCGFDMKFDKNGRTFRVPNDNLLHVIPDECFFEDNFQGLLRVIVPPQQVKQVIKQIDAPKFDVNEPNIKEIIFEKIEEKKNKPLKGVRIKSNLRSSLKKTKATNIKKLEKEEING